MDDAGPLIGGSHRYIVTAVEASLKRLKTDWIDLYLYHLHDPLMPIEESVRAAGWTLSRDEMEEIDQLCVEP
jgi:aryl-alcohol dehydrogenase-like predicted oxidoreductase